MSFSKKVISPAFFIIWTGVLLSCNTNPLPIKIGSDACDYCKMPISNQHFGAEIIAKNGNVYKFDDMHCILGFLKSNTIKKSDIKGTWFINYSEPHNFIEIKNTLFLKSSELHSPMGGNVACFDDKNKLKETLKNTMGDEVTWDQLLKDKKE